MKRNSLLFFILLSIAIGVEYEFNDLGGLELSTGNYLELLVTFFLLGVYILPICYLLVKYAGIWKIPKYIIPLSIVSGAYATGWLAGYGNDYLLEGLKHVFGSSKALEDWSAALTAPFVEEALKLCCGLVILYLLNRRNVQSAFIVGASVGLGFQIIEDISYIVMEAQESFQTVVPKTLERISGSISSHWSLTCIFSVAVICLLSKNQSIQKKTVRLCLVTPILFHFIWNSPINDLPLVSAVLSAFTIMIVIQIIKFVEADQRKIPQIKN
ncbi:PrsW family glutamic-type intramembrane protease [Enterococcus larvae]|uniref:PrsW family glutamic-type intramembrane protease n=1 Tax=Enterococcus larvae TaxID=2794352 RepID=UPI003F3C1E75